MALYGLIYTFRAILLLAITEEQLSCCGATIALPRFLC